MRYMVYARRSEESTERQVSIPDQIIQCRRYASMQKGWVEMGEPVIHDGWSGGDLRRLDLLDVEAKSRKVDVILSYTLDRIGRHSDGVIAWLKRTHKRGIDVHTVETGRLDMKTAVGKFFVDINAAAAEYHRNVTSDRTRSAMKRLEAMGRRFSHRLPYGYELTVDSMLVENTGEMLVVSKILELHETGLTTWGIAKALDTKGIRTRSGSTWDHHTIGNIIRRFSTEERR